MTPKIQAPAQSPRTAVIAAYRRVHKSDPAPNPALREGLASVCGETRNPFGLCHLQPLHP